MHFCFDVLDIETVALTCPKKGLDVPLNKCCPEGEVLKEHLKEGCTNMGATKEDWTVAINGHLHSISELRNSNMISNTEISKKVNHIILLKIYM